MPTAEAHVATERPSRYLVQLCRHADQLRGMSHRPGVHSGQHVPPAVHHVEWSDTHGVVKMNLGEWTLRTTPDALVVRVDADDQDSLRRIQDLLTARLEKFGRRDNLTVNWHASVPQPGNTAGLASKPSTRRAPGTIVVLLIAGALAVHLGLGTAVLRNAEWASWVADSVLALVVVKVVVVIALALRRRSARRSARTDEAEERR